MHDPNHRSSQPEKTARTIIPNAHRSMEGDTSTYPCCPSFRAVATCCMVQPVSCPTMMIQHMFMFRGPATTSGGA